MSINKISSANFNLIPSSTSSALLKTPNVGYVVSEFDQYLQPIQAGVQQAGKSTSVKGVSGAALKQFMIDYPYTDSPEPIAM